MTKTDISEIYADMNAIKGTTNTNHPVLLANTDS